MEFRGLYVATVTPFDERDRLNVGALRSLVEGLVQGGAQGICPVGTTGEFLYLSLGEKVRAIEETAATVGDRAAVVAGCWSLHARERALLARAAQAAGADAVFLPPPIYYPASDEVVFAHYAAVAEASDLPVFAYNIPAYAANAVSEACLERMATEGVIAGVKDSSAKSDRMAALVERFGSRIAVFAASDSFATEGRKLGAHGFISALANAYPAQFARLWAGDESLQPWVDALRTAVKSAGGIDAVKYLTARRGVDVGRARVPSTPLSPEAIAALDAVREPPAD
jgi:dihydrodipicolinate synthase/N-acetylneuraminate lyase